ncbi:hypothetical protein [Bacillus cereus]|uniref:hypothetical protein n=1 Tax=Bacillus cereus TaxID=1396 RepID=UPI000AC68B25|nr:hypothetical protein [Bacillus cereus]
MYHYSGSLHSYVARLLFFLALIVKFILMKFMKESIAGRLAYLSCLFFMYYVFKFVTE